MNHDAGHPSDPIRNINLSNNIAFAKETYQSVMQLGSIQNDFGSYGIFNNNIYAKPIDKNGIIKTQHGSDIAYYDLNLWKNAYALYDVNSTESPLSITPYQINSVIGTNKFANGSLTSNINGIFSSFTPGGISNWVSSGLDGGTLKVNTSSSAYVNTHVAVSNFNSGSKYRIRFTAKSQNSVNMMVRFIENGGSYSSFGDSKNFAVNPARNDYEFVFTAPQNLANVYMIFTVYSQLGDLWIDNIDITEVSANITNPADSIRFVYNETGSIVNVSLGGSYKDLRNNLYSSFISLQPFSSAILIKTPSIVSSNLPPVAKAGDDTIALFPVSSIVLNGTASADPDGTIVSYSWDKVSGPAQYTLADANSALPFLSNLAVGVYSFRLVVTDNNGANAADTVTTTVSYTLLPVIFVDFDARPEENLVRLRWATSVAWNTRGFEVQRAVNGSNEYRAIGWVHGQNHSAGSTINYDFVDEEVEQGHSYKYRLKQFDADGKESFSLIRSVAMQMQNTFLKIMPNPVTSSLNLLLPKSTVTGKITARIIDTRGIVHEELSATYASGSTLSMNASLLSAGQYYVLILQQGKVLFRNAFQKK